MKITQNSQDKKKPSANLCLSIEEEKEKNDEHAKLKKKSERLAEKNTNQKEKAGENLKVVAKVKRA